jgi:hypothetical protein
VVFKRGRKIEKTIHIGTAHNEVQIKELESIAQDTIHAGQLSLDLFDDDSEGVKMTMVFVCSALLWKVFLTSMTHWVLGA